MIDSFYERGVRPISATIHGGSAVTWESADLSYRVPKRDLVAAVQAPSTLYVAYQRSLGCFV